jgi:HSP20 family protein
LKEVVDMKGLIRKGREMGLPDDFWSDWPFEDFFRRPFRFGLIPREVYPKVDVYEKENKVHVKAELPGMKTEDIDLEVEDDLLTIRGKKEEEREIKKKDYYQLETNYGSFQRTVRLPAEVKTETAKASYKNGILEVELEKTESQKQRKIRIETQ